MNITKKKEENQMSEILTGQTLLIKNVISYRFKASFKNVESEIMKLEEYTKKKKASKTGNSTSVTYNVEMIAGEQWLDMEVKIPLDKEIKSHKNFEFEKEFCVENALMITHKGNPNELMNTVNELIAYINENKIAPKTPMYNVTVNDGKVGGIEAMAIDIYIGV